MFKLLDRFGNEIRAVAKDSIDMNIDDKDFANIENMSLTEVVALRDMLMNDGKVLVNEFNEDRVHPSLFETGLTMIISNLSILDMLIIEKQPIETTMLVK